MKIALVKNGKVVNTVVGPDLNIPGDYDYIVDITGTSAGIDWDYDGATFTDNRPIPEE